MQHAYCNQQPWKLIAPFFPFLMQFERLNRISWGAIASDEVMQEGGSVLPALQLCLVSVLLKVCYQRSLNNFLEDILALPDHTGQVTAVYFELCHSFFPSSPICLIDIDGVELSPVVPKRMLLPWFSVDFCANFPLKTDLGPWSSVNTCIFLFRPYWAVTGTCSQCCSSWFTAGVGRSLLVFASLDPVPASPRACGALHHHQASSCPFAAQPCLTTGGDAGNCFLPSEKHFMELEKVYFSEGGFASRVSLLF